MASTSLRRIAGRAWASAAGAVAILLTTPLLSGCVGSVSCVDWVFYETDEAMAEDATLVVEGRVMRHAGDIELFGETTPEYEVHVDDVTKTSGSVAPGDVIRVAPAPETCGGDDAETRPLEEDRVYALYLEAAEGVSGTWRTITALQGAVPVDE